MLRKLAYKIVYFCLDLIIPIRSRGAIILRKKLLKALIKEGGYNFVVKMGVVIDSPERMSVGNNVSVGEYSFISASGGLRIGNEVMIGHHVSVLTSEHRYDSVNMLISEQGLVYKPTTIGNDVWIGSGARILAGCNIGDGAVVAANSVVKGNVEPYSVVGGIPARLLKRR